jgi:hypothetical protein
MEWAVFLEKSIKNLTFAPYFEWQISIFIPVLLFCKHQLMVLVALNMCIKMLVGIEFGAKA